MNITEHIESDILKLKKTRYSDEKLKQYNVIASRFSRYFKKVNTKTFKRSLIISFFPSGVFNKTAEQRHIKKIIEVLKFRGIIADDDIKQIAKQRRIYSLKSNDFNSYSALMNKNGFNQVIYYNWVCDSDGVPRKKKIGTSNINGLPIDKNGDNIEEYDLSILKQTKKRKNQGVFSFTSKSIATEKRLYSIKGFIVL